MIVTIISKRCTNRQFCPKFLQGMALRPLAHYGCVFFLGRIVVLEDDRISETARKVLLQILWTHDVWYTCYTLRQYHNEMHPVVQQDIHITPGFFLSRPPSPLIRMGNFPNNYVQLCFSTPEIIINPIDPYKIYKSYGLWLKPPFFDQSETVRRKSLGLDRWCRRRLTQMDPGTRDGIEKLQTK